MARGNVPNLPVGFQVLFQVDGASAGLVVLFHRLVPCGAVRPEATH